MFILQPQHLRYRWSRRSLRHFQGYYEHLKHFNHTMTVCVLLNTNLTLSTILCVFKTIVCIQFWIQKKYVPRSLTYLYIILCSRLDSTFVRLNSLAGHSFLPLSYFTFHLFNIRWNSYMKPPSNATFSSMRVSCIRGCPTSIINYLTSNFFLRKIRLISQLKSAWSNQKKE